MNRKTIHSRAKVSKIENSNKKNDIYIAGREVFLKKGYKSTNISEISKLAGMGTGTFYSFYSSKEELFLEIFLNENESLKKRIFSTVDFNDEPEIFVSKMVALNIEEMRKNLVLKEWYNKELFQKMEQYFKEKDGIKSIEKMMDSGMIQMITLWQSTGKMRTDIVPEMIVAIFKSISYIDLHKQEIGTEYFPEILLVLSQLVMRGLKS